jgi:hypothetical protein
MARPKNNSAPEGAQAGIADENAQVDETQGASTDQNPGENAEHQGEEKGEGTAQENGGDKSPEASTDEKKPEGEGEKPSDSSNEEKGETTPKTGEENGGDKSPDQVSVFSESRKGKTIFAASGQAIIFDNDGKATVNEIDALYLKKCSGFVVG